ncbi:hypothetical protein DOT_2580 [Desulfosporosinus sp. OT]|nr:hypothetical protein DOT_2580 [Desulfosporosinus sp. OT]
MGGQISENIFGPFSAVLIAKARVVRAVLPSQTVVMHAVIRDK